VVRDLLAGIQSNLAPLRGRLDRINVEQSDERQAFVDLLPDLLKRPLVRALRSNHICDA
jgi:hypothetical protein